MNRVKRQQLLRDQKIAPHLGCAGRVPLDLSVHDKYTQTVYGHTRSHHPLQSLGLVPEGVRRRRRLEHLLWSEEQRAFGLQKADILQQVFMRKFDREYMDVVSNYVSGFLKDHSAGYTGIALELLEERIRCAIIILSKPIDK